MPNDAASRTTDLHFLSIAEAAGLIARRQLSPVALTRAFLDRIAAIDPQLNAYLLVTAEQALDQARIAEAEIMAGHYRGPMHGIPFALKDIYCTAGIRTTSHSRTRADYVPGFDATTVAKLHQAGAILLGKLATHEFAHGGPSFDLPWPPARNPWNREHFTGGSSSGSGAGVAAGLMMGALGSDTGGSIRNPAALCGLAGLKPTYGLVSRFGVYTNSFSYDHAGPMTWSVEDCAIMLQAIAGHDPKDPASADQRVPDYRAALTGGIKGLRIGVLRHLFEQDAPIPPVAKAALEAAFDVLRGLGAELEDTNIRPAQVYHDVKITGAESELYAVHEPALRTRLGDFGEDFLGRTLGALLISGADYVDRRDGAALREIRRAGDRRTWTCTAPGELAHDQLLAEGIVDDAVQRDRWSGAGAVHRLHAGWLAVVDADRRSPVRRRNGAAGRARLRGCDTVAHSPAGAETERRGLRRASTDPGPSTAGDRCRAAR